MILTKIIPTGHQGKPSHEMGASLRCQDWLEPANQFLPKVAKEDDPIDEFL